MPRRCTTRSPTGARSSTATRATGPPTSRSAWRTWPASRTRSPSTAWYRPPGSPWCGSTRRASPRPLARPGPRRRATAPTGCSSSPAAGPSCSTRWCRPPPPPARSGRPPRSGRALELGAACVPGLEPRARGAAVVPFRKQPLQPHVEDDEQVARTLLLQAEAAGATFAVAPCDRQHLVAVAPHDRLQRQLDGEVEVRRDERLAAAGDLGAIAFERVGRVVVSDPKQHAYDEFRQAVDDELEVRVVDRPSAAYEARAEGAVGLVAQHAVVPDHVLGIVRRIGHRDHHRVAGEALESVAHRSPEAPRPGVLDDAHAGVGRG